MEATRAAHKEMVDPRNRHITSTLTIKTMSCAKRSYVRAIELDIPEKAEAILDFLAMTASLDGQGRADLRDALMGARQPTTSLNAQTPPNGAVPHL